MHSPVGRTAGGLPGKQFGAESRRSIKRAQDFAKASTNFLESTLDSPFRASRLLRDFGHLMALDAQFDHGALVGCQLPECVLDANVEDGIGVRGGELAGI